MSKLIVPAAHVAHVRALQVTPIDASANAHTPSTPMPDRADVPGEVPDSPPSLRQTLKAIDKHLGPLRIGEVVISRVELQALGATVDGQPVSPANANMKRVDQAFLDGLHFESAKVQSRLQAVDFPDNDMAALLFYEIACKRSVDAGPLFVSDTPLVSGSAMDRLNKLGKAAQKLEIHRADTFEHAPGWINKTKSYLMSGAGVGMQAFGIYSGYMALTDAIKKGEALEMLYYGGSIAAELGSLIIERGLARTGQAMLTQGSNVLRGFALTSIGKYMSRGAGLFASAITLPFDIVDAIKSFNAAAASSGKEAQDHYFSAALSVAGAGISLVLGVAALAGFGSVAGPLGLAAAALLISGSLIYQAARVVDQIDDYIELTTLERLRSGWFAFTGKELDTEVMDRFKLSRLSSDYEKQLELSAKDMLAGAYSDSIAQVVNGAFRAELRPVELWRYQWDESVGQLPFRLDSQAVIVGGDDIIDASHGLPDNLKGVVNGSAGEGKGVFWRLGDGNDRVAGVKAQPNLFTYRQGHKALSGGDKNDAFYQQVADEELDRLTKPPHINVLDGGDGSDTFAFEGQRPATDTRHIGHRIDLPSGKVTLRGLDPEGPGIEVAHLTSFENVSTLRKGSSHVIGNTEANQISAHGHDRVSAGAGNDTIAIYGLECHVDGGSGVDRYYIAHTNARTTITEDSAHSSVIELGWPHAVIQRWQIIGTSLVINSLRGKDGDDPDHVLTLENVYRMVDGQRRLHNDRWLFRTQDGYELLAQLPQEPGPALSQDIDVAVTVIGQPAPAPAIVNGGTVTIDDQSLGRHFVTRTQREVEFVIARSGTRPRSVFLDYGDDEIIDVELSYAVQVRKGVSGNTHLTYKDLCLSLRLPAKVLAFKGVIQPIAAATGYSGRNSLKVTTPQLAQDIVVVMRDGVSYRLQLPHLDYEEDAKNPGARQVSTRSWLKRRNGKYPFTRPTISEKPLLTDRPSKIVIESRAHTGIYLLEGHSATYDIYLASNCIVRLATPGAAAKTANASSWNLYTRTMDETVTRDEIQLQDNRLRIASVTVQLPDIGDDTPVESVSVATTAGNLYQVSLLFEMLQLYVINAQGYTGVDALLAEIEQHRQRNELAARVYVTHIGYQPDTVGTLVYNSVNSHWSLLTDRQTRVKREDLFIPVNIN